MPRKTTHAQRQAAHQQFMARRSPPTGSSDSSLSFDLDSAFDTEGVGRDLLSRLEKFNEQGLLPAIADASSMSVDRLSLFVSGRITNPPPGELEHLNAAIALFEMGS